MSTYLLLYEVWYFASFSFSSLYVFGSHAQWPINARVQPRQHSGLLVVMAATGHSSPGATPCNGTSSRPTPPSLAPTGCGLAVVQTLKCRPLPQLPPLPPPIASLRNAMSMGHRRQQRERVGEGKASAATIDGITTTTAYVHDQHLCSQVPTVIPNHATMRFVSADDKSRTG